MLATPVQYSVRLVLAALLSMPASAHHSAALFDFTRSVEFSATVKELQWTNPHVWLEVVTTAADGTPEQWGLETYAIAAMKNRGWNRNMFTPGDRVAVRVQAMRDGTHAGQLGKLTLPDGRTFEFFTKAEKDKPSVFIPPRRS